jgi:hypothetical protein
MTEGPRPAHPERSELIRRLRSLLPKLADPLEIVAEQILGLESRIDFVTKNRRGQVVLVFLAERGSDLRLLADSLAQRSWMEPRVADWLKLAPQLGLRPELGVRVLLLAPQLDPRTIAAARSVEGLEIDLGICRPVSNGGGIEILIDFPEEAPRAPTPVATSPASGFRTGLREEDLSG